MSEKVVKVEKMLERTESVGENVNFEKLRENLLKIKKWKVKFEKITQKSRGLQ